MILRKTAPKTNQQFDFPLFVITFILSIFGTVMVYSGSVLVALRQGFEPQHYFIRQLIWVALGLVGGYIAFRINYRKLPQIAPYALGFVIFLLIAVLLLNWGDPIKRWIDLGFFDLQPSELAKLVFLVYLSSWLAKHKESSGSINEVIKNHFLKELLPFLILLTSVSVLILVEPDMDTTVILGLTSFLVYFISGNSLLHVLGSFSVGTLFITTFALATKFASYRLERFSNWYNFWVNSSIQDPYGAGYQLKQILVAVASGGIFGVGFGESRQKFHYLGETAFSDTIFAIFAEEFGFIGSIILISAFFAIMYRGFQIARKAPDKLGFLLAISITIWITLQASLHIASNVALIPINGNTLPFISYGGSSTIINLTAIGLLLNISRSGPKNTSHKRSRVEPTRRSNRKSKTNKLSPKQWIKQIFD